MAARIEHVVGTPLENNRAEGQQPTAFVFRQGYTFIYAERQYIPSAEFREILNTCVRNFEGIDERIRDILTKNGIIKIEKTLQDGRFLTFSPMFRGE
ncbi:MAG: hypothetical protein K1X28_10170 [Parachlamydiales bacterium]|nr:hypothetical protein [Parachlamydiales bacterium]